VDRDFLLELFSEFGPVTLRRMFSGYGVSADGVNFAMALRGGLIFRVDGLTLARYDSEGAKPFQYDTKAKTVIVNSYRHLPERLYDDPEELAVWAREAVGAAQRAALKKSKKKKSKKSVAKTHTKLRKASNPALKRKTIKRKKR
jgi:DNA transformation protein